MIPLKHIFLCMLILFLLTSCNDKENKSDNIDASKVKEITIINKVYCSTHNLEGNKRVITNRKEIEEILNGFSYSEPIVTDVNMKMNNGFFDISFNEGEKEHIYTLNYTIYNGVILWHNGKLYRNDRLEVAIYPLFVK